MPITDDACQRVGHRITDTLASLAVNDPLELIVHGTEQMPHLRGHRVDRGGDLVVDRHPRVRDAVSIAGVGNQSYQQQQENSPDLANRLDNPDHFSHGPALLDNAGKSST